MINQAEYGHSCKFAHVNDQDEIRIFLECICLNFKDQNKVQ